MKARELLKVIITNRDSSLNTYDSDELKKSAKSCIIQSLAKLDILLDGKSAEDFFADATADDVKSMTTDKLAHNIKSAELSKSEIKSITEFLNTLNEFIYSKKPSARTGSRTREITIIYPLKVNKKIFEALKKVEPCAEVVNDKPVIKPYEEEKEAVVNNPVNVTIAPSTPVAIKSVGENVSDLLSNITITGVTNFVAKGMWGFVSSAAQPYFTAYMKPTDTQNNSIFLDPLKIEDRSSEEENSVEEEKKEKVEVEVEVENKEREETKVVVEQNARDIDKLKHELSESPNSTDGHVVEKDSKLEVLHEQNTPELPHEQENPTEVASLELKENNVAKEDPLEVEESLNSDIEENDDNVFLSFSSSSSSESEEILENKDSAEPVEKESNDPNQPNLKPLIEAADRLLAKQKEDGLVPPPSTPLSQEEQLELDEQRKLALALREQQEEKKRLAAEVEEMKTILANQRQDGEKLAAQNQRDKKEGKGLNDSNMTSMDPATHPQMRSPEEQRKLEEELKAKRLEQERLEEEMKVRSSIASAEDDVILEEESKSEKDEEKKEKEEVVVVEEKATPSTPRDYLGIAVKSLLVGITIYYAPMVYRRDITISETSFLRQIAVGSYTIPQKLLDRNFGNDASYGVATMLSCFFLQSSSPLWLVVLAAPAAYVNYVAENKMPAIAYGAILGAYALGRSVQWYCKEDTANEQGR